MGDGVPTAGPFGNVPPWVWVMLLLGGGGGLGTITGLELGGNAEQSESCAELEERVNEAEASHRAMAASISTLTDVIKQCNSGSGWIDYAD